MLIDNIIRLPIDLAVVYAAEQNFHHDVKIGTVRATQWEHHQADYLREVIELFTEQPCNYAPRDDSPWIHIQEDKHTPRIDTVRSNQLVSIFDLYYDSSLRKQYRIKRPDPRTFVDSNTITRTYTKLNQSIYNH